jgi:aryl-alcohol dehydrogenase-like predicted oxidoreductase
MQRIVLGNSGITSSVLGFGCSALLGRCGRSESLRALHAAWNAGITLYDTARSYGYGESEALLGEFLHGRRDQAVITTKFGIVPSRQQLWKRAAKPVARALLKVAPRARSAVRRGAAAQMTANQFSIAVLHQSVEQSLRKLRTDYVDFLFMHAAPLDALHNDELLAAMQKLVLDGKVRVAGISADPPVIQASLAAQRQPLRAMQFPCNLFDFSALSHLARHPQQGYAFMANHPFGGVQRARITQATIAHLAGAESTPASLREKLQAPGALADTVLNAILRGTGVHVVLPAMMKPHHLQQNVQAVNQSRFTREDLEWLRDTLPREARHEINQSA